MRRGPKRTRDACRREKHDKGIDGKSYGKWRGLTNKKGKRRKEKNNKILYKDIKI